MQQTGKGSSTPTPDVKKRLDEIEKKLKKLQRQIEKKPKRKREKKA